MDALVLEAVTRLKRSQPRNADTILICNALEAVQYREASPVICPVCAERRRLKAAAMRRYRGKPRAEMAK
jgi:hypothetical protein